MEVVEEIINVKDLVNAFNEIVEAGELEGVMKDIILQSKIEFNF